jgi:hypothetical protein
MSTKELPVDVPDVQGAIYGVALSLDAFLLNGIQYGVLQNSVFPGFLQKTSDNLLRELASLEELASHAPAGSEAKVTELLASLRAKCCQLIDLVASLISFRSLPFEQMREVVSQIQPLRGECVRLIEELEACFQTSQPFYRTRPADTMARLTEFLTNVEPLLMQDGTASLVGQAAVGDRRAEFDRLSRQVPRDPEAERSFIESKIEMIRMDPNLSPAEKERAIEQLRLGSP